MPVLSFPHPFGYIPSFPVAGSLSYSVAHFPEGIARLIEQYRGKPRMETFVGILMGQIQALESALWQLLVERRLETSIGAQLDGLGDIVGAERQGFDDDNFVALIRARIRANHSEGTIPEIYGIVCAVLGNPAVPFARLSDFPPAGFILSLLAPVAFDEGIVNDLVQDGRSAGVRGVVVAPMVALADTFTFSAAADFPSFSVPQGFDSAATPGTGTGKLARAMDETT